MACCCHGRRVCQLRAADHAPTRGARRPVAPRQRGSHLRPHRASVRPPRERRQRVSDTASALPGLLPGWTVQLLTGDQARAEAPDLFTEDDGPYFNELSAHGNAVWAPVRRPPGGVRPRRPHRRRRRPRPHVPRRMRVRLARPVMRLPRAPRRGAPPGGAPQARRPAPDPGHLPALPRGHPRVAGRVRGDVVAHRRRRTHLRRGSGDAHEPAGQVADGTGPETPTTRVLAERAESSNRPTRN
jgi:hypothetical protein